MVKHVGTLKRLLLLLLLLLLLVIEALYPGLIVAVQSVQVDVFILYEGALFGQLLEG